MAAKAIPHETKMRQAYLRGLDLSQRGDEGRARLARHRPYALIVYRSFRRRP
jgi:hypothetical protein